MAFKKRTLVLATILSTLLALFSPSGSLAEQMDRYIIKYKNTIGLSAANQEIAARGVRVERVLSAVFKGSIVSMTNSQANALSTLPFIDYIEKDQQVQAFTTYSPAKEVNALSWGLDRINQISLPLNNNYSFTPAPSEVKE